MSRAETNFYQKWLKTLWFVPATLNFPLCSALRKTSAFTQQHNRSYPAHLHDRTSREGHQAKQQLNSCWPRWTQDAPPGPRIPYPSIQSITTVSRYSLGLEASHPRHNTQGWQTMQPWDILPPNLPPLPQHQSPWTPTSTGACGQSASCRLPTRIPQD